MEIEIAPHYSDIFAVPIGYDFEIIGAGENKGRNVDIEIYRTLSNGDWEYRAINNNDSPIYIVVKPIGKNV